MKLISLNSRESCHVLDIHDWEILFTYGAPVAAWKKDDKLNVYRTSEATTLASMGMVNKFFDQVMERMDVENMDQHLIDSEVFENIVKGNFESE